MASCNRGLSLREIIAMKFICPSIVPSAVLMKKRSVFVGVEPSYEKAVSGGLLSVDVFKIQRIHNK